ncbi:MAG: hypothetical protein ACLQPH_04480 [Acidimicrobiales bacterium]
MAALLELVAVEARAGAPVPTLGLDSCCLVKLLRALVSEPVLSLADKPSSGLDTRETRELAPVPQLLQRERDTVALLVELNQTMVGSVIDRTIVMDLGLRASM